MAQFTLSSKDVSKCLISLSKRLPDAIGWVGERPRKITIRIPDAIWQSPVGIGTRSQVTCDLPPKIGVNCILRGLAEERTEIEILLGVLEAMGGKGGSRSRTRRRG